MRRAFRRPQPGVYALSFQSANYQATVWVDGHQLGSHRGSYLPFEVRPSARRRQAHVVVRVDWRDPAQQSKEGFHRTWFNWGGLDGEVDVRPIGAKASCRIRRSQRRSSRMPERPAGDGDGERRSAQRRPVAEDDPAGRLARARQPEHPAELPRTDARTRPDGDREHDRDGPGTGAVVAAQPQSLHALAGRGQREQLLRPGRPAPADVESGARLPQRPATCCSMAPRSRRTRADTETR
jgi:hypothetical protein